MKAFNTIMKLLAALAALAGAVYVVATYGDKIVAWAKKLWATLPQCPEAEAPAEAEAAAETPAEEEAPAEDVPAEDPAAEEAPTEDPTPQIAENEPVADEADFAE